jgi:COP9 signalosome complex subunit 7
LNETQLHKLRLLSLLPLATTSTSLTYPTLLSALALPKAPEGTRALEDLVISAIYSGLLTAKLDTRAQIVEISSISPSSRDVPPGGVQGMEDALSAWSGRCEGVLGDLERQIKEIKERGKATRVREGDYDDLVDARRQKLNLSKGSVSDKGVAAKGEGKRLGGDDDLMEIDDENGGLLGKRKSARSTGKGRVGGR